MWRRVVPHLSARGPTNVIAGLDVSSLTAGEETRIKGSSALFFKRHAVELYELSPEEAAAFMRDAQRASKAVHEYTGAIKMNYETHGNTIPHLHTRFPDTWATPSRAV